MYCDQCPEVLSGKGCTKNGPCKTHRMENATQKTQENADGLSFSARLKNVMGIFGKGDSKKN